MEDFKLKTRVKNTDTGEIGTICPDCMGCCSDNEIPVVYDGSTSFLGTQWKKLEIIGPENAVPNPEKCGAGKGDECCIFLVSGQTGFQCERFGNLRIDLIMKTMNAKRNPSEKYPDCMKF